MNDDAATLTVMLTNLESAVRDYLDHLYQAEMDGERSRWPSRLAEMTGWSEPDEEGPLDVADGED